MNRSLSEFSGTSLYLDVMIPYALLRGLDTAARDLFARVEAGDLQAYTSVLTLDELAYRMLQALLRDNLGEATPCTLPDLAPQDVARFYPQITPVLAWLRVFPNLILMDVTAIDLTLMDENMTRYQLRPREALHLAAMQKSGCFDLASNNSHFDRVPEVRRYTLR